ncbi:MAG: carboxylating nicotinate-nucleotide diphosphorylase [Bifidobacterium sp.]|jgi:nicotinate-nucleotide pyrophosphorylase (carboxylating)|nr:carboxylating nicotinate-nucleotide diphosphorylase [Bifidobacterium sp.]MCH4174839.1 carboxylating nicotinate-nucleotide diphosphorylase [Bifidobacterium sp.]
MLTTSRIRQVVEAALQEDAPTGDISCAYAIDANMQGAAQLVAREAGVMSGMAVFEAAFKLENPQIEVSEHIVDGGAFAAGQVLAQVSGAVGDILTAERVALNFIQRMSGIATLTAAFVAVVGPYPAHIVDTRKTTPGLRDFEKYAVTCGGGFNHRQGLSDAVMLKDNHLAALSSNGQSIAQAIKHIRSRIGHTTHIEVEIDRLDQLEEVLRGEPDTIMFDNFSTEDLARGVRRVAGRTLVEASGNMSLSRVPEVAHTGVDLISVGALTHSVRSIDLGLDWLG